MPDPDAGARLAPALARRGWNVSRLLVMVKRREPDRPAPHGAGAEVDRQAGASALAAFRREQPLDGGSETIRQLAAMDERFSERVAARDFAAPPDSGHASCRLFSGHDVGQVDQVGTSGRTETAATRAPRCSPRPTPRRPPGSIRCSW